MIDKNELRIGNWVRRVHAPYGNMQGSSDEQIKTGIDIEYLTLPSSYCEGIHLTEEWLKRFGFSKAIGFYIECPKIGYHNYLELGINTNTSELQWYCYYRNNKNSPEKDDFILLRKNLKYVHELMNLFYALTGTELTARDNNK